MIFCSYSGESTIRYGKVQADGGISECRNPSLQQMFLLIGRAEKAGSGVDKIMAGWKELHWRRPYLELESQPDKVKLTLPMFSVIPDSTLDELRAGFGDITQLPPNELIALSFCLIEGSISNHRLQYVLNMHRTDITSLLKKLCAENYLESDNNGRWTTYKIKGKVATSDEKVATSDDGMIVPDFHNKKLKGEDMEIAILQLCKNQYVKKEDIAKRLGKSENYLRNKILPNLLKQGKIKKRYPYTHNHPEQGYKTTDQYANER
jgi:predicted HTH transcriptional regulator